MRGSSHFGRVYFAEIFHHGHDAIVDEVFVEKASRAVRSDRTSRDFYASVRYLYVQYACACVREKERKRERDEEQRRGKRVYSF